MKQTEFPFVDSKVCRVCGEMKPKEEFYRAPERRDGRSGKCKACQAEYYRRYIAVNKERLAEQKAGWYDRNREHAIQRQRDYYFGNRDRVKQTAHRWRESNPEKVKAGAMARSAIASGEIEKQPCSQCGNLKAEAHHDDYTKPLEVRWLCRRCHRRHHANPAS